MWVEVKYGPMDADEENREHGEQEGEDDASDQNGEIQNVDDGMLD